MCQINANRTTNGSIELKTKDQGPLISVVVAVRNGVETLQRCIDSVVNQNFHGKELVIIDGQSDDGTIEILRNNAAHINFWLSERDNGICDAWNKGIDHAQGKWICFIGADDYLWQNDSLSKLAPSLELMNPAYRVVYGKVATVSRRGNVTGIWGVPWLEAKKNFFIEMSIPHQGVMHHRGLFEEHGKFDQSFRIAGDYEFLLRELETADALFVPDVIVTGMQEGGLSSRPSLAKIALNEFRLARLKHGIKPTPLRWIWRYVKAIGKSRMASALGEKRAESLLQKYRHIAHK